MKHLPRNSPEHRISPLTTHNQYELFNGLRWPQSPFSFDGLLSPYVDTARLSAWKNDDSDTSCDAQATRAVSIQSVGVLI